MTADSDAHTTNRDRKMQGRAKRRRYVQGTRAYTHAVLNSIAKRAANQATERTKRS